MLIGAGMLIGGLAKCWGLIHPIAASACMAGVVIVAAAAAVYVYMQLKDLYAECDNNFCRGVIDMAGQVWFGEVLARLPALQRIQDDIGRLNDRIRNTENEIANKEIELELTQDPQERARLQLQLQRLRDHLRKLQMQMGFKEAELLSAQRNIEPWRNKKTSTEWCIRPGPGQGG